MSTLPRDPSEIASAAAQAPLITSARQERNFDEAIREFTAMADELGIERPSDDELRELCQRVAAMSVEVFPGNLVVKAERDWEIPGDIYFVFNVRATGSGEEIAARSHQWHVNLGPAAGNRDGLFCLSFDVQ